MKKNLSRLLSLVLVLAMVLTTMPASAADMIRGDGQGSWWDWWVTPAPIGNITHPEQTFNAELEDGTTVTVVAREGILPAKTRMTAQAITNIDAVQAAVDQTEGVSGTVLTAVDITFMNGNVEVQPNGSVKVMISNDAIAGMDDLSVVHLDVDADELEGDEQAELVENAQTNNEGVVFNARHFSVYAVVDEGASETQLLTVEFYQGSTKINAQAIRMSKIATMENPVFDPGVPTLTATQSFEGWSTEEDYSESDHGYSVEEINAYVKANFNANSTSTTLRYYAKVYEVRYIVYHDQAGAVLRTQSYHVSGGSTTSVKISLPYVGFMGTQNFAGWITEDKVIVEGDYPLYTSNVAPIYQNDTNYNLSDTLQLYPYLNTGHWLVFDNYIGQDNDDSSASYTSPVFYAEEDNTAAPATPTRTGYEFVGWYKDKNFTNRFIFGSTINEDTTLYAKWEAKNTTYQVVFWQQNVTDAIDAADSEKTYSFYKVVERGALTGSSVELIIEDSGTAADNRLGGNSTTSIGEMGFYFAFNEANSDMDSKVVNGDGSTVLNVYYDRKVITYNFYGVLESYTYSQNTYNSNYPYYGVSNNNIYRLTRSGSYWYLNGNSYTGTVYHLADFDTSSSPSSSNRITFGSIQGLWFSSMEYFDWSEASTSISGNEWPYSGHYLMWHHETTGRYQNRMFQYETGTDTTATTVNYYLAEYEVGTNTRPYTCIGQDTNGNFTIELDSDSLKSTETVYFSGDEYYGYVLDRYNRTSNNYNSATVWDGKEVSCSYNQIGSNGHAYFYYARNKWDLVFESNSASVKTENVYWEADLTDFASYVPTNGPEGHYFDGWYADPAFDTEFDFTQVMPNHSVAVYAKWTLERFRVILDPTGGEAGVQPSDITFPGNQATTFRVDYGELVQASSINNAQRQGYTLLGWFLDPEFTQPFNFASPVTEEIADMSYATASASARQGVDPWNLENGQPKAYNDADGEHDDVRGKVVIYAHWRQDPDGVIGINVRYLATDSQGNTGKFSDNSTVWDDGNIYADQAQAYAQPASTPDDSELRFLYWEILDRSGNRVGKAYPGQTFDIEFEYAVEEQLTAQAAYYTYGDKKPDEESRNGSSTRSGASTREATTLTTTVFSDNFDEGTAFTRSTSSSGTMSTEYWTAYNPGRGNNWSNANTAPYSGSYSAVYQYSSSYAANCYLISKPFKVDSSASDLSVSFYQRSGSSSYPETYEVFLIVTDGVTTNGAAVNATHYNVFTSSSYTNTTYTLRSGSPSNLSALKGKNVRLVIHCTSAADMAYLLIDDVTVTQTKTGETVTYELVNTPEAGKDYVIVVGNTHAVTNTVYSNNRYINAASVVNNGDGTVTFFADEESSLLYRVGGSSSGWTFYNQAAGKYLGLNASDSHWLSMISTPWEWLYTGTDLDNQCTDSDNQNSSGNAFRYLSYSTTYDDFTTSTGTGQNVKFYKKVNTGYTVTFVDGHTNEVIDTQTVEAGGNAVAPAAPDHSADGYAFNGWDTDFSNVQSDLTVTAQYVSQSELSYTVTFRYMNSNGEWVSESQTVQHGQAATPPTVPTPPAGYTFNSWDKNYTSITSNITINAVYKQVATTKYVITLRAKYGLANLDAKTHIFWFANNDDDNVDGGDVQRNTGIAINDAISIPTPDTFTYATGAKDGETATGLEWEDHVFLGWARLDNDTGTHPEGIAHHELTEDDLFLKWDADSGKYIVMKQLDGIDDVAVGAKVSKVAADEAHPYHDMYAVWASVFYVYHSADNTVEKIQTTKGNGTDSNVKEYFDITKYVRNAGNNTNGYLYGGYYAKYNGTSKGANFSEFNAKSLTYSTAVRLDAVAVATDAGGTAYNGSNVTWSWDDSYNVDDNAPDGMHMRPEAGATYYLKEVPANKYLQPYLHYGYNIGSGAITSAFLISDIDDRNYQETGFVIVNGREDAKIARAITFNSANTGATVKLNASMLFGASGYLSYLQVIGGKADPILSAGNNVMQYWLTPDGLYVTGTTVRQYTGLGNVNDIGKSYEAYNAYSVSAE